MARGNIFSTISCVEAEAGTRPLNEFIDMYKEFEQGGQLYLQRWMLRNFTMNDFLLGVMVLCGKRGVQNSAIDTVVAAIESRVLALLEESHAICVERFTDSRDARKVSHAIRLTLHSAKSSNMTSHESRVISSNTVR
jgi:hypothetical protein